jgi:hypothetical protein
MRLSTKRFGIIATAILVSAAAVFLVLPRTSPDFVKTFDREGGMIELLSALFYLVGFVLCAYRLFIVKTRHDRAYLYLWAALCVLFFGEETSWLQHVIGYGTPQSIAEINVQNEFNLHNLFETGSLHEALTSGQVSIRHFLDTTTLFRLGFLFYFLILPTLMHAGAFKGFRQKMRPPLPSIGFITTLFATLTLSLLGYYFAQELRLELTEAREAFYALFIMLYVFLDLGTEPALDRDRNVASQKDVSLIG